MFLQSRAFTAARLLASAVILSLLALTGCFGDSEAAKKRLLETGNKYFDQGKFKEASIIYRKVLQKDQRYGEAYYRLGLSELKQGRYGDAVRWLRRASELQPENDDAHSKLGDMYLTIYLADRSKYKQLLVDFQDLSDRLLKRNPKHYEGLRMRGYLAVANENWKESIDYFQQALAVKPNQGPVQLALANAMVADKRAEEAIELVRTSLDQNKNYGPMYDFLYAAALSKKDMAAAENILNQKVTNNPGSALFVLEQAGHYWRFKDPAKMTETLARLTSNLKQFPDAYRMVGDFYFRGQRFPEAFAAYSEGIKQQPEQKASFMKKQVELLALQNKRADAVTLAQKIVDEFQDDAEAKALRASLRLQSGDPKEVDTAIAEFRSVLSKMQDNPVVRFNLGEALLAKGDVEAARAEFAESIKLRASYIPPKLALGNIHLSKREYPRAQQLADEILQLNQNFLPARLLRVSAQVGLGDNKTAREELKMLLGKVPDLRDAQYLLARIDLAEGKTADAESGFKTLMDKNDPRGIMGLVETLMNSDRAEQARLLLEAELKKNPANAQTLKVALANIAVRTKKFDQAIDQYKQLIDQNPKSAGLYVRLGETLMLTNRQDEAINAFSKATELAPNEVLPMVRLAMTYEKAGKRDAVEPLYKKILQIDPTNYVALNNMAYGMVSSGKDVDQALTYAQKAKQYAPSDPDVDDTMGLIYTKKNQPDNAIRIFRDLLDKKEPRMREKFVAWRIHLAEALFVKGDKLQAKKELDVALQGGPTPDERQQISALMKRIE
ncbi:MAG: tetratricopeptide repeat protein [Bryobacterales bacterium]|nr:tetratricopeptide repeat protein [Bryobacterales bacterium]